MKAWTLQWKEGIEDELQRVICGLANGEGGELRVEIGEEVTAEASSIQDIMDAIRDLISDALDLYPEIRYDEGAGAVSIVAERSEVPVDYEGRYYVCSQDKIHMARGREYDRLVERRSGRSWLDMPIDGMDETRLDCDALAYFRRRASEANILGNDSLGVPDDELLTRLRLMVDGSVTRAGILLFHSHPEDHIGASFTRIGMF